MMHPSSIFVALLAAAQLSGGLSFVVVARSARLQSSIASASHSSLGVKPTATPLLRSCRVRHTTTTTTHAAGDGATGMALPRGERRRSCLGAAGGALGEEESAPASEKPSVAPGSSAETLENSVGDVTAPADPVGGSGSGAAGASLDLAKGIAFEAPKPKTGGLEMEEESESKKVRVILYTVLSLVPFLLLLPFLGGRELMPLDPSQM